MGTLGVDQSFLEAANAVAAAVACLRLSEDSRWRAKSQLSVRMETCECVEVQEDRVGRPLLEGRGTDHDSDLEFEGGKH